jgi:hypothetical protein
MPGAFYWHTITSILCILTGAAVLLVSIVKLKVLFTAIPFIPEHNRRFIRRALNAERFLMVFFLVGYLSVAAALLLEQAVLGKIFIGLVFLFGAIFVWTGTALTVRILDDIQTTLQGLLPICLSCKRIRKPGGDSADQQAWTQIESYISGHTGARFSHGLCPECLAKARERKGRHDG